MGGGYKIFVAEIGGSQFYRRQLFVNLRPPSEENASPLSFPYGMRTILHYETKFNTVVYGTMPMHLHHAEVLKVKLESTEILDVSFFLFIITSGMPALRAGPAR